MASNRVTMVASYIGKVIGVKITAHKAPSASRTPFHLVLLVDISGSMAGERINEVKHTILELMKLMDPMDYISIITYHSSGDVLLNSVKMEGDTAAYMAAVSSINILGGTNLEAGLSKLSEITLPPSSVFLLTDGQIMEGNTDPAYLITYARLTLPPDTPIHTLGYGSDYNQKLLSDLASKSKASHTYADRNETIPLIIGNILGGLTTEVGRSTRLIIPAGYKSLELNFDGSIGRLIDEKTHWVLLEAIDASTSLPTEIEFHWSDGVDHVERVAPIPTETPDLLTEQILRAQTAQILSNVTDLLVRGKYDEGKTLLQELKVTLDTSAVKTRVLIIQLRAQVDSMIEGLAPSPYAGHPAFGGIPPPPPMLQRVLSSGASTTAYVSSQGGVLSAPPMTPLHSRLVSHMSDPFSTPTQIANMRTLSQPISYNNSAAATDPYEDEDISSAGIFTPFVGSNSAAAAYPPPPLLSRSTPLLSQPHEEISDEDIE
jgi:hypothetical protein